MQRQFTETVGRFAKGEVFDYPKGTWDGIERSVGKSLDKFTALVLPKSEPRRKGKTDGATSPRV